MWVGRGGGESKDSFSWGGGGRGGEGMGVLSSGGRANEAARVTKFVIAQAFSYLKNPAAVVL